jgi:hypothetical protein
MHLRGIMMAHAGACSGWALLACELPVAPMPSVPLASESLMRWYRDLNGATGMWSSMVAWHGTRDSAAGPVNLKCGPGRRAAPPVPLPGRRGLVVQRLPRARTAKPRGCDVGPAGAHRWRAPASRARDERRPASAGAVSALGRMQPHCDTAAAFKLIGMRGLLERANRGVFSTRTGPLGGANAHPDEIGHSRGRIHRQRPHSLGSALT